MKIKYAGKTYKVKEVKEYPHGVMFGIEDEPNHIDYINPSSCEVIGATGFGCKETGLPYPKNAARFD
jgi:hypothetical protein